MKIYQSDIFGEQTELKIKRKKHRPMVAPRNLETVARFVHLGAGWQSSTIVEMIVEGVLPRVDAVIFADTGDEGYWVYEQVWYLAGRLDSVGIPLIVTDDNSGMTLMQQITDERHKFVSLPLFTRNPKTGKVGRMKRQCTRERKITPCTNIVLGHLLAKGLAKITIDKNGKRSRRVNPGVQIEDWYGISTDELDRAGKRGANWRKTVYPLLDMKMSRKDCGEWLEVHGLPVPDKSACVYCPFSDDERLLHIKTKYPVVFEVICVLDDWFRSPAAKAKSKSMRQECYIHSSCTPLRTVDLVALVEQKKAKLSARGGKFAFASEVCGDHCMT